MPISINKCRVIKNGIPLVSKENEVWFALKSKNMSRADVKEFRVYLNECAEEFLVAVSYTHLRAHET